jgi:hypothetical protein
MENEEEGGETAVHEERFHLSRMTPVNQRLQPTPSCKTLCKTSQHRMQCAAFTWEHWSVDLSRSLSLSLSLSPTLSSAPKHSTDDRDRARARSLRPTGARTVVRRHRLSPGAGAPGVAMPRHTSPREARCLAFPTHKL